MEFNAFWTALQSLEKSISIKSPIRTRVKAAYWGAPSSKAIVDLPCVINTMSEPGRILGFGSRDQDLRISVQLLAAKATVENDRSSVIATALWFAAKDVFDHDYTLGGNVSFTTLQGADQTVPVILGHAGQVYIGFNAVLEIRAFEGFTF